MTLLAHAAARAQLRSRPKITVESECWSCDQPIRRETTTPLGNYHWHCPDCEVGWYGTGRRVE